jgi:cytoskeletal protein CcmA (bactofilin family)
LISVLLLVLLPTSAVFAQGPGPNEGKVIFGSNFTLESGETFVGDLVVFGGNVDIEEDADLNGSLVVFGGTVHSNGTLDGDVVVVGGQVSLDDHALVTGDVVTVGGQVNLADGAVVEGEVVNNIQPEITLPNGEIPRIPEPPKPSVAFDYGFNFFGQIFQVFFWATIAAGFAMLLSLFWKPQMERASDAIVTQPLMVGAVGLLAFVIGVLLFLTVIPPLVVGFAWLFGIVALGSEVGERFTKAINQAWTPVLTVGAGTFLLVLISGAIGFIPCLGGLAQFLLGLLAIGSVVITRFGGRPIQSSGMIVSPPPQT